MRGADDVVVTQTPNTVAATTNMCPNHATVFDDTCVSHGYSPTRLPSSTQNVKKLASSTMGIGQSNSMDHQTLCIYYTYRTKGWRIR